MIRTKVPHRMPVLWLNGPDGVGKSTVGFVIFRHLSDTGTKTGYVDLDQLTLCYPAPEDDPENYRIRATNLAGVWATYRDEGVRCMVISGIAETDEIVKAHTDLLPEAQVTVVRLRVALDELRRRFIGRGWQPQRIGDVLLLAEDMDRNNVGDVSIDIDRLTPAQAAELVCATTLRDWPGLS
jgi:broad-specificity NMP kinase